MSSFPPPFNLQAAPTTGTKSDNTQLNRILERDLYIKLVTQMRVCVSRTEREHTWPNIRTNIRGKKERKEKKKKENKNGFYFARSESRSDVISKKRNEFNLG